MIDMNLELLKTRFVAFGYELFGLVLFAVLTMLSSDTVSQLVTEHFGSTVVGSLTLLVLNGIVKHARNLQVLKKYESLGGQNEPPIFI